LIPFLSSDGDIQLIEVDWERGLDDVPLNSKLRVLTGVVSIYTAWYILFFIICMDFGNMESLKMEIVNMRETHKRMKGGNNCNKEV
jgi:hypothetical protein